MAWHQPDNRELLLNRLAELRDRGSLCDVIFIVQEKEILAHKVIVASWSPKLEVQFQGEFASNQDELTRTIVEYNELDYDGLLTVIKYMYGEKLKVTSDNCVEILTVAKELDVPEVKNICENFGKNALNDGEMQPLSPSDDDVDDHHSNHDDNDDDASDDQSSEADPQESQAVHKLPILTEIFFGRSNGDDGTSAEADVVRNEGVQTCADNGLTSKGNSYTKEHGENGNNESSNVSKDSGNMTENDERRSNCDTTEGAEDVQYISEEANSTTKQIGTQTTPVNNRSKSKRKCGRPRKLPSYQLNRVKYSLLKSQDKKESQVNLQPTRKPRKRNKPERLMIEAPKNDVEDCSMPVKKRKLRDIKFKSTRSQRANRTSESKPKDIEKEANDENNDEHIDDEEDFNDDDDDDVVSDEPSPSRKVRGKRKPYKKRKMNPTLSEKQAAAMVDVAFEKLEREFVEMYELLRCHRCSAEFKDKPALYVHVDRCKVKAPPVNMPIWCSQCDVEFTSNDEWLDHRQEYHGGKRPGGKKQFLLTKGTRPCHFCDLSYKTYKLLEQHMLKAHNFYDADNSRNRLLICKKEGCNFMAIRYEAMYTHYKRHNTTPNKFRIQCPLCNTSYVRIKCLERHMKKEHSTEDGGIAPAVHRLKDMPGRLPQSKNKNGQKTFFFQCKHCSYKNKKKNALQKHMLATHREHCDDELISHLLRCPHTGCEQEFVEHKGLKNHLTTAHGHRSKVHICGECGAQFLSIGSLCAHMRQHKEKTVFCPYEGCEYKTHTNLHLRTHIKHKHMGEEGRDHLCHLCGYKCHTQGNLKLHLLNRHHLDLKFRRIRKKGQQFVGVPKSEEPSKPTQPSSDASESALPNPPLPNNNQVPAVSPPMNEPSTSHQSSSSYVLQNQRSDLEKDNKKPDAPVHDNPLVKPLKLTSHNDYIPPQNASKIDTQNQKPKEPLPHPQFEMRTQNYVYVNPANSWQFQGDYNSHFMPPNPPSTFTPMTIHPDEYAQLMTQESVDHSRNLDLIQGQSEPYLPPMDSHYHNTSNWKYK